MKNVVIIILLFITVSLFGQKKDRFIGETELKDCELQVDLYYSTKRIVDLMKSVEKYKDIELALVTIDKKKGTTYTFYYLVGWESSFGPSAYLIEPKFLEGKPQKTFKVFLDYKPKKHIFYDAKCFRENPAIENLRHVTFESSNN